MKQKSIIIYIIIVLVLWVVVTSIINYFFDNAGTFGDSFGAINSLFTGLAFALLIYTSQMQKKELELQRKELKLQREELQLTRFELKKSAEAQQHLVKLSEQQLTLQKKVQWLQMRPKLNYNRFNWFLKSEKGWFFEIAFSSIKNEIMIIEVNVKDKKYGFECTNLNEITQGYFREKEEFKIQLYRGEGKDFEPKGLEVSLVFKDIGKNTYTQSYLHDDRNLKPIEHVDD